jgi:hypothetical protein
MQRKIPLAVTTVILVLVAGTACAPAATPASAPAPGGLATQAPALPPTAAEPANEAPPSAPTTASGAAQPPAAAQSAPLCQTTNACADAAAEQHEIGCVDKIPYTNILVAPDTQFEVMDKSGDFSCSDSGTSVDGKTVLTCHGKQLFSFDLKLTGAACSNSLSTGSDQCQEGYGYDAAQQCCAPVEGQASGSTTVRVDLGACPLPRPSGGG